MSIPNSYAITFPQIESSYIDIQIRFAQIIFSYKSPATNSLLQNFVNNTSILQQTVTYAITTSIYGDALNPQLSVILNGLTNILDYSEHYFHVKPQTDLSSFISS